MKRCRQARCNTSLRLYFYTEYINFNVYFSSTFISFPLRARVCLIHERNRLSKADGSRDNEEELLVLWTHRAESLNYTWQVIDTIMRIWFVTTITIRKQFVYVTIWDEYLIRYLSASSTTHESIHQLETRINLVFISTLFLICFQSHQPTEQRRKMCAQKKTRSTSSCLLLLRSTIFIASHQICKKFSDFFFIIFFRCLPLSHHILVVVVRFAEVRDRTYNEFVDILITEKCILARNGSAAYEAENMNSRNDLHETMY